MLWDFRWDGFIMNCKNKNPFENKNVEVSENDLR